MKSKTGNQLPNYIVRFNQKNKACYKKYIPEFFDKKNIKIGLIDTGIGLSHPIFQATKIIWKDFTGRNNHHDNYNHGTHSASILVKFTQDIDKKEKELFVAKALFQSKNQIAISIAIRKALLWMQKEGVNLIVIPIGTTTVQAILKSTLVNILEQKRIIIIASVGNYQLSLPLFPSSVKSVICVSALDRNGNIIEEFYHGSHVDVFVSAENIGGAISNNEFGVKTGTSQAACVFAGMMLKYLY